MIASRPPIVICGCHGGGTSFVAKMLRLSGLFIGSDAGLITDRKHHESAAFRDENMRILERWGDRRGMLDDAVKKAFQELSHSDAIRAIASTIDVERLLSIYMPCPSPSPLPWGWKDPRNSLTFPIWHEVFPNAKAVVITKELDERASRSKSGYWFRNIASSWIRQIYMEPPWIASFPNTLFVAFEDLTVEFQSFNQLLAYCELPSLSESGFSELLEAARFEQ